MSKEENKAVQPRKQNFIQRYFRETVGELRKVRQLEEENGRLKRVVADLTLDKHILQEALRKKA